MEAPDTEALQAEVLEALPEAVDTVVHQAAMEMFTEVLPATEVVHQAAVEMFTEVLPAVLPATEAHLQAEAVDMEAHLVVAVALEVYQEDPDMVAHPAALEMFTEVHPEALEVAPEEVGTGVRQAVAETFMEVHLEEGASVAPPAVDTVASQVAAEVLDMGVLPVAEEVLDTGPLPVGSMVALLAAVVMLMEALPGPVDKEDMVVLPQAEVMDMEALPEALDTENKFQQVNKHKPEQYNATKSQYAYFYIFNYSIMIIHAIFH